MEIELCERVYKQFPFYQNRAVIEGTLGKGYSPENLKEAFNSHAVVCNLCQFGRRGVKPVVPKVHSDISTYFMSLFPGYSGDTASKSRTALYIESVKRKYLEALGLPENEVCFSTCVYCTVRSANDITSTVLNTCWNWKMIELLIAHPTMFFLMDSVSMNQFLGIDSTPINFLGKIYKIYDSSKDKNFLVVPLAHPIMTLRDRVLLEASLSVLKVVANRDYL